ncbi:MAG: cytochrome c, partial [Gaiellaceae bacterium]
EQLAATGKQTFTENCGACHTLADAGTTGTTGPNLDDALPALSEDEIRTSIVDPNAVVEEGFEPGIMPQDFEETLTAQQLDGLVAYLATVSK